MSGNAPVTHVEEALKLTGDAIVSLFELTVVALDGTINVIAFRDGPTVTYQSKTYESLPARFTGDKVTSDNSASRPTLDIKFNPGGLFNTFAFQGLFEGSTLIRKQVLGAHLAANVPIFDPTYWRISCVKSLISNQGITFELRAPSDIPNQFLPVRVYTPPEFPFVSTTSSS